MTKQEIRWIWLGALVLPFLVGWMAAASPSEDAARDRSFYPEKLDGAFTGGFGEPTCHSCHFDYDLNYEQGSLELTGVPDHWKPEATYPLTIRIQREDLAKGGFQLSIRTEEGEQAGAFSLDSDRLTTATFGQKQVTFLQHDRSGTNPTEEGIIEWTFEWTSPGEATGSVHLHLAANAGNGDDSSFGDWIYLEERVILPEE